MARRPHDFSELAFTSENGAKDYLEGYVQAEEERFGAVLGPFFEVDTAEYGE